MDSLLDQNQSGDWRLGGAANRTYGVAKCVRRAGSVRRGIGRGGQAEGRGSISQRQEGGCKRSRCFVSLGNGTDSLPPHNAAFDFNDEALGYGARFRVEIARRRLSVLGAGSSAGHRP